MVVSNRQGTVPFSFSKSIWKRRGINITHRKITQLSQWISSEFGRDHSDTKGLIQKCCNSMEKAAVRREFRQAQHRSVFATQRSKAGLRARLRMSKEELCSLT